MGFLSRLFMFKSEKNKFKISDYDSLNSFWTSLITSRKWFLEYSPKQFPELKFHAKELAPLIAKETNKIRYQLNFSQDEYFKIMEWDRVVTDAKLSELLVQYCSNCKSEINMMQRYPKAICETCKSQLTSSDGRKVEFYNTDVMGTGCQGYYVGTNQEEKYNSMSCYIGDKTFVAEEHRFGGVVIQLK